MTKDESKLEILKKVQDGTLSVEEGSDLIGILERGSAAGAKTEVIDPPPPGQEANFEAPRVSGCWKAAWSMILVAGAVLLAFSAFWVYQGYEKAGFGWGFWLSWIPFLIGLGIMIFGWILMDSPWLHARIKTSDLGKLKMIVISIPVPFRLVSWVIRTFPEHMPKEVREKGIDDMLEEIENSLKKGEPFMVDVDDKEDGDQVFVYISK